MALVDLIAQSGAKNFETMRKGWLPTAQEKAAEDMARLQVQAKRQAVANEPERQRLENEASSTKVQYQKSLMEQHKLEAEKFKTLNEKTKKSLFSQEQGSIYREAIKLPSIQDQKNLLMENKDKVLPPNATNEQVNAFNDAMDLGDQEFTKRFRTLRQGNTYIQKLNKEMFGEVQPYYNARTGQIAEVSKDSPDYYQEVRDLKANGYVSSKKLGIDLKGDSKLGKGKRLEVLKEGRIEEEAATINTMKGYKGLIDFVSKDEFKGGVVGGTYSGISSIYQQGKQLFGYGSILKGDGSIDYDQVEMDTGVMADIRRIASSDARYAGALMEMAYMKAKSLDKGGRVTDADFKFAKKMLDAGDKGIIIQLLKDNIYRLEDQFNTSSDIYNREYGKGKTLFNRINADKTLGFGEFDMSNVKAQQIITAKKNLADLRAQEAELLQSIGGSNE